MWIKNRFITPDNYSQVYEAWTQSFNTGDANTYFEVGNSNGYYIRTKAASLPALCYSNWTFLRAKQGVQFIKPNLCDETMVSFSMDDWDFNMATQDAYIKIHLFIGIIFEVYTTDWYMVYNGATSGPIFVGYNLYYGSATQFDRFAIASLKGASRYGYDEDSNLLTLISNPFDLSSAFNIYFSHDGTNLWYRVAIMPENTVDANSVVTVSPLTNEQSSWNMLGEYDLVKVKPFMSIGVYNSHGSSAKTLAVSTVTMGEWGVST